MKDTKNDTVWEGTCVKMGWLKLFDMEKAPVGGDFVTAVTGTEMNRRNSAVV